MKKHLFYFFCFLLLFLVVFRNLFQNLFANLIDWRDYAYVTWVINENINHLKSLNFYDLFNLNILNPHLKTIFLSDTLLTQSVIGVAISFFTNNPILIFNMIFFITFLLNYLSAYSVFFNFFKKEFLSFIGGVAVVFSPFFYTQLGHFQMQNYWPFLFIIFLLFKNDKSKSTIKEISIGLLLFLQFLASVYLSFFSIAAIALFFVIKYLKTHNLPNMLRGLIIISTTFLLLSWPFIKGYVEAKDSFGVKRDSSEYITYSAKIFDYIFPHQNGILYKNSITKKWLAYNKHHTGESASFPGLVLGIIAIYGLIKFSKSKDSFLFEFSSNFTDLFFLSLLIIGFLFSLGYPYLPFAKYLPFFDAIRATARWSFIFYIGLVYFAILFLSKVKSHWIFIILSLLIIIDVIPSKVDASANKYIKESDNTLKNICLSKKTVLLEVPVTHLDAGNNIAEGLSYITKSELATIYTECYLANGYSGYDLPELSELSNQINMSIVSNSPSNLVKIVKNKNINILRINRDYLSGETALKYKIFYNLFSKLPEIEVIGTDLFLIK